MGKNLNKEKILNVYNQGLSKLIYFIENQECLIFEDEFSEKVSDIVLNYDYIVIDRKINKLLENEFK
jgi:uncharacterized protein YutD